jgi:hypothetical protein
VTSDSLSRDDEPGAVAAMRRVTLCATVLLAGLSCHDTGPDAAAARRVLFIGNSLTASNDLPALVREIARADGRELDYDQLLAPGVSLEDHWNAGAAEVIADVGAEVVILQQGPSSLPESQDHLRTWAERFAVPIREAGGTPALLMVWPEDSRREAFDAVSESYRSAAAAVDGLFIPAGDAWRAAWERDPDLALYGGDGFHPSPLGSLMAALTVYAVVFDADVGALPASAAPGVPRETFDVLVAAVRQVVAPSAPAVRPR